MININRLVENAKKMYPLMEYSLMDLHDMSDDGRRTRSLDLTAVYAFLDQGQSGHARTHWAVPSQSGTQDYECIVEFHVPVVGGLFGVARKHKGVRKSVAAVSDAFAESEVKVYCNCKDFYWSGMKYNLGPKGDYKNALSPGHNAGHKYEKTVVTHAPDKRDPERKHIMCKHLLAVVYEFGNNAKAIMKDAKTFDNNIKINDEISRDLDDGKRALNKDVELVEVTQDVKEDFLEPLEKATDELQKSQENQGSEEIIQERDEPEEISREVPEEAGDIIDEENEEREPDVTEDDAQDIIDEENELREPPETETEEIIDEENEVKKKKTLEKDKEESDVSDDVNDLLGK